MSIASSLLTLYACLCQELILNTYFDLQTVEMYAQEPPYKSDNIINYYPRHVETGHLMHYLREYGLFRDEHADFKEDFLRLKVLRGKGPRPFGSGEKKSRTLIDTR